MVRDAIEARLHLVPRFRQLLYVPRRGLGGPLWVDAPTFDLSDHVQVVPLAAPADEAQLLTATERLRRRRLDRSRPLWGMWFLPGLPDGRIGLFVKMHHVIADAIAGVATLGTFLDPAPEAIVAGGRPGCRPIPRRHRGRQPGPLSTELGRCSKGCMAAATLQNMQAGWQATRELLAEPPAVQTSLDRMVGPDRSLALIRSSLSSIKEVAHAHDAKVKDVLLAATAGGLRALLRERGEDDDDLIMRIAVPVSLRKGRGGEAGGNRVGEMVVPMPIGEPDPTRRLRRIAAETADRKTRIPPSVGMLLRNRFARRLMLKAIDRQRVNVNSADVPGPPMPLYLAGAPMLEVFPVLPLIWRISLGIGAMSYAGQFNITVIADRDGCPDIEVFAAGMRDELRALGVSTHPISARSGADARGASRGSSADAPVASVA